MDEIEYFTVEGEFYHETKISGGGGGGLSVTGAIAGGILWGPIGAVIGSLDNKIEANKSETIIHDTRKTILHIVKGFSRGIISLDYSDYNTLKYLIPEKDLNTLK